MDNRELVYLDCQFKRVSSSGLGLCVKIGEKDVWFPISQIELGDDLDSMVEGEDMTIGVPLWMAESKGVR